MARPGRKAKSPTLKLIAGTDQPCRQTEQVFEALPGDPEIPPSFHDLQDEDPRFAKCVLALWERKLERYQKRKQAVVGYEDLLYTICVFEAQVHDKRRKGELVTAADLNALRVAHESFYDTPAANVQPSGRKKNEYANRPKNPK